MNANKKEAGAWLERQRASRAGDRSLSYLRLFAFICGPIFFD